MQASRSQSAAWQPAPEHPGLRTDALDIWQLDLLTLPCSPSLFDKDETTRLQAFRHSDARRQFCVSRTGLRNILGKYLAIPPEQVNLRIAEGGKPRLEATPPPLYFNLSHAGSLALLAIREDCDIGIDIEHPRPIPGMERIARRMFSDREIAGLESKNWPQDLFFRTWSHMEARQKCLGRGVFGEVAGADIVQTEGFSLGLDYYAAVAWQRGHAPASINYYLAAP